MHQVLESDIPLKDKCWFMLHNCFETTKEKELFAFNCIEIILPIFEKQYPDVIYPRDCLESAKYFLLGKVSKLILREKLIYVALINYSPISSIIVSLIKDILGNSKNPYLKAPLLVTHFTYNYPNYKIELLNYFKNLIS